MTAFRLVAHLALLAAACSPVWSYASVELAQTTQPETYAPSTVAAAGVQDTAPAADKPRLTVGVSDPNTQLILPWFLTDIVNAVNSHTPVSDFAHSIERGL